MMQTSSRVKHPVPVVEVTTQKTSKRWHRDWKNPWKRDASRNLPAVQWQQRLRSSDWFCFCSCLSNPEETMERSKKYTRSGGNPMAKAAGPKVSRWDILNTTVLLSKALDFMLFQQDCHWSTVVTSILNKQDGLNGQLFKRMHFAHVMGVGALFKPMCNCYSLLKIFH